MTKPKSQLQPKPTATSQIPNRPQDDVREGHYQPMQMHLSAKPPAKSKFSTHLGITIRWGAPPPGYLPVASGGGAASARGSAALVGLRGGSC